MNDELLVQIERYLGGSMTAEEAHTFEEKMKNDPDLRNEVTLAKQINHHLRMEFVAPEIPNNSYVDEIRAFMQSEEAVDLKERIRNAQEEYSTDTGSFTGRNRALLAASITALLIMAGGFFYLGRNSPEKLYAKYYNESDLPAVIKRGEESGLLEQGVLSFQNEKYTEAVEFIDTYLEDSADPNMAAYIYRGVSKVWLQDYENAMIDFNTMIQSNSIDASKGLWFKTLTFLKMKDKSQAIGVLEEITKSPGNFKYEEAQGLLKRLK